MNKHLEILITEKELLYSSAKHLEYSYNKSIAIINNKKFTNDELEILEAFSSRFVRTSDILIQKILRLLDIVELEESGTVLDRINRAEKRGLVENADILKEIRALRNEIAHEYIPEELNILYKEIFSKTPTLLKIVDKTIQYIQKVI